MHRFLRGPGCLLRERGALSTVILFVLLAAPVAPVRGQDILVDFGSEWGFFRGTVPPSDPPEAWREPGFDDATWETGPLGIGYGDGDDATVLDDMEDGYAAVFLRTTFDLPDPAAVDELLLSVDYDDAFILYLNGFEVIRSNIRTFGEAVAFDALADGNHEAGTIERFDVTGSAFDLVAGENTLAVEVHNVTLGSTDLSFDMRLSANDPRLVCPQDVVCSSTLDGPLVSWAGLAVYDSISVTRNGVPLPESPLPGDAQSVLDPAGSPGDTYEVTATIRGVACDPISCTSLPGVLLIADDEDWAFFRGTEPPSDPADAWIQPAFDDSLWEVGFTGIGYADGDDRTVLDDMEGNYVSVFLRKSFEVDDPTLIGNLLLEVDYDDGFIAYMNGVEVARSATMGMPGEVFAFDQTTSGGHEAGTPETFDLSARTDLLVEGLNLLAVEVHNTAVDSSDLSFIPRLSVNACATVGGLACALDDATGEVTVSWSPLPGLDSIEVLRNGEPLPESPLPSDTTGIVDVPPAGRDVTYEVRAVLDGFECGSETCTIMCDDRSTGGELTCTLSLVGGVTQARLDWTAPAGAEEIEIEREGAVIATLAPGEVGFLDPDVESDEPEDDTDYTVIFRFPDGETCSFSCGASLCPEGLVCEVVDDGGILRPRLSWTNIVKEWDTLLVERDGVEIAALSGDATAFIDDSVEAVFGEPLTYTILPVAPPGEEVGTACDMTCTVSPPPVEVGEYDPPPGGWDYFTDFSGLAGVAYNPVSGATGNLDGDWIRAIDLDAWDGSSPDEVGPAPGGPAPGGVGLEALVSEGACGGDVDVLRILDPGNTSNPGATLATEFPDPFDPPNNASILLGIDTGIADRNLLRDGVTFAARWRVNPGPPAFLNAQPTGDGAPLDDGVGQIGFYYRDAGGTGGAGETAGLAFTLQSGDSMQMSTEPVTTLAAAAISRFRSVWVTVEDPDADEAYDVTVWMGGEETPFASFTATAAALQDGTADFGAPRGNYLAIGAIDDGQDSDVQFDFVAWKEGVHAPSTTPCVPTDNNRPTARIAVTPATSVRLTGGTAEVTLNGESSDDGDGGTQGLAFRWTKVSGPGGDTIASPGASETAVTFTQEGSYRYRLRVDDSQPALNSATATIDITVLPEGDGELFRRGDIDGNGSVQITDPIALFTFLFLGGVEDPGCFDAADADDSGSLTITDGIRILSVLFLGQGEIPPPGFQACGVDPTPDGFPACVYPACP